MKFTQRFPAPQLQSCPFAPVVLIMAAHVRYAVVFQVSASPPLAERFDVVNIRLIAPDVAQLAAEKAIPAVGPGRPGLPVKTATNNSLEPAEGCP